MRRAAVLVLAAAAACGGGGGSPGAAARVEGETISMRTTDAMVGHLLKGEGLRADVTSGDITPVVARKFVVEYLIRMAYLEHAAKQLGVDAPAAASEAEAVGALPEEAFASRGWSPG